MFRSNPPDSLGVADLFGYTAETEALEKESRHMAKRKAKKKKVTPKDSSSCLVIMPFRDLFDRYYSEIFEKAVDSTGLRPIRADSLFRSTPIMADLWEMVQEATVVLAELTTKNANVFYELGLAHAIGKPVVLVTETMDDVPFDLQAYRVIVYDKNNPRWGDKLREETTMALRETLENPLDAVPSMFRKKVKSQAPEDTEVSIRLEALEQQIRSFRDPMNLVGSLLKGTDSVAADEMAYRLFREGCTRSQIRAKLQDSFSDRALTRRIIDAASESRSLK